MNREQAEEINATMNKALIQSGAGKDATRSIEECLAAMRRAGGGKFVDAIEAEARAKKRGGRSS